MTARRSSLFRAPLPAGTDDAQASWRVRTVPVAGVDHRNSDGTSRWDVVRRCQPGQSLRLVREPAKHYGGYNLAVQTPAGERLGYLPAGDVRLLRMVERAAKLKVSYLGQTGGPRPLGRLFPGRAGSRGCLVEIACQIPPGRGPSEPEAAPLDGDTAAPS